MKPQLVTTEPPSETQSASHIRLRGPWLTVARLIWILISTIAVVMLIVNLVTYAWWYWTFTEAECHDAQHVANNSSEYCLAVHRSYEQVFGSLPNFAVYIFVGKSIETLPWILIGGLIFWRKSQEPFALLFSLGIVLVGALIVDGLASQMIAQFYPTFMPLWRVLYFMGSVLFALWYGFPDGRFVPRAARWIAIIWILWQFSFHFLSAGSWPAYLPQVTSVAFTLSVVAALIYRYKRVSVPLERQQIRWIVVTGTVFGCIYAGSFVIWPWARATWGSANPFLINRILDLTYLPLYYLGSAFFAVGIGISILRYHLWDIDIIINRTLVYGTLTASVIGTYVLVVGVLGTIMQSNVNWLVSILATGLIAVLVQPLRDRLQRGVNRLMYGERDDPITVLSRLGQQLETALAPDTILPSLVETVAQRLRLPYVAIETITDNRFESTPTTDSSSSRNSSPKIAYGAPQSDVIRFPLVHQSETIGQLLVAPRASGEALSPMDRHLLENIARQAGMAVHAVSLTNELQRARQRLVTAVEEERRRLRRDLHDGLGPALASQGLKLAAAKQLLKRDPDSVESLLDQVMTQNQETVGDVRRLVYGLRPPVLDERGLAEAIRDHVLHTYNEGEGLNVEVGELPADLQSLPAAVEVAAYRIALEALTNVIRHASAKHCTIRFTTNGNEYVNVLQIEIADNGIGLPRELRAGVGLRSMRERSEELGGRLVVEPMPRGGTRVIAILPLGINTNSRDFNQIASADYR